MSIQTIGPWILLTVGTFILSSGAIALLRGVPSKKPWIWIFGLATCGVAIYGPAFLIPYEKFISSILEMQHSPTNKTYAKVFDQVGHGDIPPDYQELALAYALDRPIPGMEDLINKAISEAPNENGRTALMSSLDAIQSKKAVGEVLQDVLSSPTDNESTANKKLIDNISRFDSATKLFATQAVLLNPNIKFTPENKERLKSFTQPRKSRVRQQN